MRRRFVNFLRLESLSIDEGDKLIQSLRRYLLMDMKDLNMARDGEVSVIIINGLNM